MKTAIIIIVSALFGFMSSPYMAQAIDRQEAAERKLIQQHKAYIAGYIDNLDNVDDIDEDVIYFASERYQNAKHANEFLRANREDKP